MYKGYASAIQVQNGSSACSSPFDLAAFNFFFFSNTGIGLRNAHIATDNQLCCTVQLAIIGVSTTLESRSKPCAHKSDQRILSHANPYQSAVAG